MNIRYFFVALGVILLGCSEPTAVRIPAYEKPVIDPDPPADFLSPEESMNTFYMPEGFSVELVASEPLINEPVHIEWDPNGRLFVTQMETYMQDIDASKQDEPWSKIVMLEDTDGDGQMDKSHTFIDSLLLPRILLPLDDRVIVGETYTNSLWSYRDTDGDNIADEKILLLEDTIPDRRNLEHQPGNLTWNIDNWMYLSRNALRYRFTNGVIEVDTLMDAPGGQWGLTQDETGRMYYSTAGGENPALGFQVHPSYGTMDFDDRWEEGFEQPWPVIGTPDVQGGTRRIREDGTLNHFTGVCGQSIYVGDLLPFQGDLFLPEPVGRLVRRAKVENIDGKIFLTNAYEETEFLASTDANFRPVDSKTGPDGSLYIVDMYRGIIQEGNWVREGSYLREVVARKEFDKNVGKGRIYRVVHKDSKPYQPISLLKKSSEELVDYLGHPNGWYRLNSQKLLVLRQDQSIKENLRNLLDNEGFVASLFSDRDFGIERLHALWTLEGLDALDESTLLKALSDEDVRVRSAAIRLSEPFVATGNELVMNRLKELSNDAQEDINVSIQLALSMRTTKNEATKKMVINAMSLRPNNEVLNVIGTETLKETPPELERLANKYVLWETHQRRWLLKGYDIYKGLCAECHGERGEGKGDLAPALAGSPRVSGNINRLSRILLHGLQGEIDDQSYTGVMIPMKNQDDEWIASVLTYIRAEFNGKGAVGPWRVRNVRNAEKDRTDYWTLEELEKLN
ncbi:MAG: cytochrome C [Cyclobacteriaceae bacterium]